jgi:hypothetical protein
MNRFNWFLNQIRRAKTKALCFCATVFVCAVAVIIGWADNGTPKSPLLANNQPYANPSGSHATFSTSGSIDLRNEFFQSLGTNGRSCVTCHRPEEGWTVTPAGVQERFKKSKGSDPIFRTNDGSNSPNADVGTLDARRDAYSMLLTKGLIRVGIGIPQDAEFELAAADDPYGFASSAELSLFRRPLPATNLTFLSTVMWDGRETFPGKTIHFDLSDQSNSATVGHAQGTDLTDAQRESIVNFETALFTAQVEDKRAGNLTAQGAESGPVNLAKQEFYIGINNLLGDTQTGAPFNPVAFNIYDAWKGLSGKGQNSARAAVARGEELFNTKLIRISGVSGINDEEAFGRPDVVNGTCTTCHDTPNSGNHSVSAALNLGLTDPDRRTSDMPLYTLRNKTTGEIKLTTDPGRALVTGKWIDIGRFKGPVLRGLPARAPYFHNGSAKDLEAVVNFYDERFGIGFTDQEKSDLLAFLRTL